MPTHRRGQSLSDALTLERLDDGTLVVSSDVTNQNLKEGHDILGATINFEELSKEEVLHVLKVMEPFNDKVHIFTRNNRSKSLGNLDQCVSPETMLTDSYNKLYNTKIKKFMRATEASSVDGESNGQATTPGPSKVRLKHAAGLPRLGVDFGFLKTRPSSEDLHEPGNAGDATYGSNLNLPPLGLGTHVPLKINAQTPQLNAADLNISGAVDPKVNNATGIQLPKTHNSLDSLAMPHLERTQIGLDSSGNLTAPKVKMDIRGSAPKAPELQMNFDDENSTFAAYSPKVQIEGTNKEVKMGNMGFSGPSYSGPEYEVITPSVPSGKQNLTRLKTPVLNIDDPSSYVGLPKVKLSGRSPDLDLDISGEREYQPDLNGSNIDAPPGKLTLPKFGVSGKGDANGQTPDSSIEGPKVKRKIQAPNINALEADPKGPKLESDTPSAALKGPSTKYKAPKFTMPKFDLPEIYVNKNLDLKTPDVDVPRPKFKGDINLPGVDTKLDLNKPSAKLDLDADAPSEKLRLPKFKLFGALPNKEGVDINAGMTTTELKMKYDINMDVPDTKVKSPKLDLSGTLPKGPELDVNTDLKSPDFTLKTPKIKGGIDTPSVNLPNMEVKTPEINIGSAKTKTPKFKMPESNAPSLKSPEIDSNINGPDVSINAPSVNLNAPDINLAAPSGKIRKPALGFSVPKLDAPEMSLSGGIKAPDVKTPKADFKGPRLDMSNIIIYNPPKLDADTPDVNIGSPKGKIKMPNLKMPRFSLPNFKGPDLNAKTPSVNLNGPKADMKVDVAGPKLNLNAPKPDLDMASGKLKMPEIYGPDWDFNAPSGKVNLPKSNLSLPKGPHLDVDADLKSPDLKLKAPKFVKKSEINTPDMNLKTPELDTNAPDFNIASPKGKFKMPKFKVPKFSFPSFKGPEIDGNLRGPDTNFNQPSVSLSVPHADLKTPDISGPSGKFKKPNLNLSDMRLSGPSMDGPKLDLQVPDLDMPTADLKSPKLNLNATNFNVPNTGLQTPDLNLKAPNINCDVDTPHFDTPTIDIKAPKLDVNAPNVTMGSPKAKLGKPKMQMPKFDIPSLKGPNIDGSFDCQNMDINAPSLDFRCPKADLDMPDVDVGSSGKFKMPNLNLPDLGLSGPKLDGPNPKLKSPGLDVCVPSLSGGINAPDINIPKADMPSGKLRMPELHGPDWDINPPSNNLKFPKFNLSGSLPKGPNVDLNADLKSPDVHLKSPEMKGGINAPDWDLPNIDLKAPKFDVKGPDVNIGSPKTRLKMPKLKMPKVNLPNIKGPEIDGNFDGPDVDIGAPNGKLKGTKPSFEMPDVNFGANMGSGLKAPNITMPDVNLKSPKLDYNTPNLDIDMPSGKVKMPTLAKSKAEFHAPDMDVDAPQLDMNGSDVNIGSSKSKFKLPKLKFPKFSFPGLKGPEIDGNINTPDVDGNVPNMNIRGSKPNLAVPDVDISGPSTTFTKPNIRLPNFDLSAPKIESPNLDMKSPELDFSGSPKGKLRMPKMKKPKISLPNLKGPEIDGNLGGPDLNAKAPSLDFNGPKSDFDINVAGPSGKFKKPTLNMPDLGISSPALHGPNLDLKSPGFDISGPNVGGGLKAPKFSMQDVNLKRPKLNLNTPNLDIDMPSGKMKMPKGPNLDLNADVNSPDLSLKSPKIKGAFETPDIDLPDMRLKAPKLDVNTPDVNIGSPKTRLKMPKFKMPKVNLPNIKGPEIDGNFDGPDVDIGAPNVKLKGTKPSFEMPDVDFGANMGSGLKAPNITMPDVNLKSPKHDFNAPNLDIDMPSGKVKMPTLAKPKAEFHAPDMGVDAPSGKLKFPKFNLSGTLPKGPNLDLNADVNSPDLSLKSPKIKGAFETPDIDLPDMRLKAPKLDVNTPDVNIGSPKTRLKMPKFKMPKVNLPNIKGPEIDGNFDGPDVDISAPNVKLKGAKPLFEIPEVGFGSSLGKLDKPHVSIPNVGFSSIDVDGPDLNTKLPKGTNININSDLNNSDIHLRAPKSKIKGGFHSPNLDLLKMDNNLHMNAPDIKKPKIKMPKSPRIDTNGDLQGPDLNVPNVDVGNLKGKLQMQSINMPDVNLPESRVRGPRIDPNTKRPDLEINGNMRQPDNNFSVPQVRGDIRGPDFDMNGPSGNIQGPQFDHDSASRKLRLPSFKLPQLGGPDLNRAGSDIDFGASLQRTNFSPPNANLSTKPAQMKGDITGPSFNTPTMDLGVPKGTTQNPQLHRKHPDLNIDDPLLNFKRPSVKNRRSDITGVNMKMPALDVDEDVRPQHHKRLTKMDVRSSYPFSDAQLGHHIGFDQSDLNIDDFTGKDYVLRARGSKNTHRDSRNHGQLMSAPVVNTGTTNRSQTGAIPPSYDDLYAKVQKTKKPTSNVQVPNLTQDSGMTAADSTDGYLVTVFPSKIQNSNPTNRKYKTLGGAEFYATDVDLEVPNEKDLKGSTFFFSNLV